MECPWGTTVTEQQHASVTLVHRHHPDYFLELLLTRAGLHALRRLMPQEDREAKAVRKLEQKPRQQSAKCPQKITGRMVYLKELVEHLQKKARHCQGR
eukprot:2512249-Lingulodinium_polyedra.AAC.1